MSAGEEAGGRASVSPDIANDPAWKARHDRYADLGRIGRGGMGEVRRVRDQALGRVIAMKTLPWDQIDSPQSRARFLHEMRTAAALQHPGIVPVHDSGELPDGRLWFTMKEVRGDTLRSAIAELHSGASSKWSLRRLVEAFSRVCEAMAYAHSHGVVHRDLKPENLMVGEFGEVLVMDWGLVKHMRSAREADDEVSVELDSFSEDTSDSLRTLAGDVIGTPAYMSPEQARGELSLIGPASDVYSLGAVLYEILCARPPYVGTLRQVWASVVMGSPEPLEQHASPRVPVPPELAALCRQAMERAPSDRFPNAGVLGAEVRAWLDGAFKRERALAFVDEARRAAPRLLRLRERARLLAQQAREVLGSLKSFAPASEKARGWALEDEAASLRQQASLDEVSWLQTLRAALNEVPDLTEAHEMLADYYRAHLTAAEDARDTERAVQFEALLRLHDRGAHAAFVSGRAAVSLVTDPPGAEVSLYRYVERERVLVLEHVRELGPTPLREVPLTKGSYVLKARAPGCHELVYPVSVGRGEHWSGVAPGEAEPRPIRLLRADELEPDAVYVPAGWFIAGGDPEAGESLPRQVLWCEAFVVQRYPVTNAQYLAFLNDLVATGHEPDALAACPRARPGIASRSEPALLFARVEDGAFRLGVAGEPTVEEMEWPVAFVDWYGAVRYARWLAARTGKLWRLLNELEWEKAARGVDGRLAPWGDHIDPVFACMLGSHAGDAKPVPVSRHPVDCSPYGVRGMAGNVRDWCINVWKPDGPEVCGGIIRVDAADPADPEQRAARGGAWTTAPAFCRLAARFAAPPHSRFGGAGLRLARSA